MSDDEQLSKRHQMIQGNLQQLFREDSEEELPDRFRDMIARLKGQGASPTPDDGDRGEGGE